MMNRAAVQLALCVLAVVAVLQAPDISFATDIDLNPGYIAGTINSGSASVGSFSLNATGGGNTASKTSSGNTYSMTVQGGDFNYAVAASAGLGSSGVQYANVQFSSRTFPIHVGETVTNNYDVSGAVRFHLTVNGDPYTTWSASTYARKDATATNEQSYSDAYTGNPYSPDMTWIMPVVPNEQIRIYGYVWVDNTSYRFWASYYNTDWLFKNITAGETIDVYLTVDYKKPIPYCEQYPENCITPPPAQYDYGSVQGSIFLDLPDPSTFVHHRVSGAASFQLNANPAQFSVPSLRTGTQTFAASSYFYPKSTYPYYRESLGWPMSVGRKDVVVQKDQIATVDFSANTGVLTGKLKFTGTLTNADMNYLQFYSYDKPGQLYAPPAYAGFYYNTGYYTATARNLYYQEGTLPETYQFILPEGSWLPFRLSTNMSDYTLGYYRSRSLAIYDLSHYNDGGTYNYGKPSVMTAGATVVEDREYCLGSVTVRIRDYSGGTLSSPSVNGFGTHTMSSGKIDVGATVYASVSVTDAEAPEMELHGPGGVYVLTGSATAQDGTKLTFAPVSIELECGVRKCSDRKAPSITMASPAGELITNSQSVTVSGTTTDEYGIQAVLVNDVNVNWWHTGNPALPNEVAFSHELSLDPGKNHIRTFIENTSCNSCFDERNVYVDRWIPTVSINAPADGTLFSLDAPVAVKVDAADQGYGFTLSLMLDGAVIGETKGAADETAPAALSYAGSIGPLPAGTHVLRAVVTDAAGNMASQSVTIQSNRSPIANAGPDQVVECAAPNGTTVALDGSATIDPDDDTLEFVWTEGAATLASGMNPVVTLDTGTHALTLTVSDGKGGSGQSAVIVVVRDSTASVTVIDVAGIAGTSPWYTSDVQVTLTATDTCSGVQSVRYTLDGRETVVPRNAVSFTVSSEAVHSLVYGSTDNAGNPEVNHTAALSIDKSVPVITAEANAAPNVNGWNNTPTTVSFRCTDTVSGIATCALPVVLSQDGANQRVSGEALDNAGLRSSATLTVNLDMTAPVITISGVTDNGTYPLCSVPAPNYSAVDMLSGTSVHSAVLNAPTNANGAGGYTYTVTATDKAGNAATRSAAYTVSYGFGGFLPPVTLDRPFKKGSTIPVKFTLNDGCGGAVTSAVARLTLQLLSGDVPVGDPIDASSNVPDSGNVFRYSGTDGGFIYNLATAGLASGSYRATVTTDDGQVHTVVIQIKP